MAKDKNLAETAYQLLKEEIILGKLMPGDKLTETVLAERFQMSRTPIREALANLERDGLAEFSGSRAAVRRYSADEIIQLYELRQMLEVRAAVEAAGLIDAAALAKLEFCCQEFDRLVPKLQQKHSNGEPSDNTAAEIALNDFNFHMIVIAQSSNSFIRKLSLDLRIAMLSVLRARNSEEDDNTLQTLRETHWEMYYALKERDAAKVQRLFSQHISDSRKKIEKRFGKTQSAELDSHSILREPMENF